MSDIRLADITKIEENLNDIADAIRLKTNGEEDIAFDDMAGEINNLQSIQDIMEHKNYPENFTYYGTYIWPYAFHKANFKTVYAPNLIRSTAAGNNTDSGVGSYIFANCPNLESINLPSYIGYGSGGYQFASNAKLTYIYLPRQSGTGQYQFSSCTGLKIIVLGQLTTKDTTMNTCTFSGCTNLNIADLKGISKLDQKEFQSCTKLQSLILRRTSSIVTMGNSNALSTSSAKSGGTGCILYSPLSLLANYQTGTNWTTFFGTARASGYTKNHISPIENSVYQYLWGDEVPISDSLGTIPTLKVFKGKGVDNTGITTDTNMAITAPFTISTSNPINIHWNKFEATNATCTFKNCLTSTTDIDTSTEGNFIPHDMKGLDGTSSTFTEWMTAGGVNFIGKVENDLFADTAYSTSNGYGRLVFKNKTDGTSPISDTIEGYVTIQGTLYHLIEAPIEEFE